MNKILIIKLKFIGDVVLSAPVFALMRADYPDSHITVLLYENTEPVCRHNPYINEIITIRGGNIFSFLKAVYRIMTGGFSLAVDLTNTSKSAFLCWISWASQKTGGGVNSKWFWFYYNIKVKMRPDPVRHLVDGNIERIMPIIKQEIPADYRENVIIYTSQADEKLADSFLAENGILKNERFVVIHPGGRWKGKCWYPERFAEICRWLLQDKKIKVILSGGKDEIETVNFIAQKATIPGLKPVIAAGLPLLTVAAIFKRASLFIGNDSGPMHIASAAGTPVIAIFGPTVSKAAGPVKGNNIIIESILPCCPCTQKECSVKPSCMELIATDKVKEAVLYSWRI